MASEVRLAICGAAEKKFFVALTLLSVTGTPHWSSSPRCCVAQGKTKATVTRTALPLRLKIGDDGNKFTPHVFIVLDKAFRESLPEFPGTCAV
jgi:hypothetical protein